MNDPRGTLRWTVFGAAVLVAVLVTLVAAWASGNAGPERRQAIAFAAAVCGPGAIGAWLLARWPVRTPAGAVSIGLGAVALRLLVPLSALAWLQAAAPRLREAGAGGMVLTLYLALLATDLALTIVGRPKNPGNSAVN